MLAIPVSLEKALSLQEAGCDLSTQEPIKVELPSAVSFGGELETSKCSGTECRSSQLEEPQKVQLPSEAVGWSTGHVKVEDDVSTVAGSPVTSSGSEHEDENDNTPSPYMADVFGPLLAGLPAPGPQLNPLADEFLQQKEGAPRLLSQGSMLHGTGYCRPCAWFHKPVGCQSQEECGFCHVCPEGALKTKKKSKLALKRLSITTTQEANNCWAMQRHIDNQPRFALSLASLI
mmetsp:Transcript_120436/g.239695  ORF Transcript_120436/g.239695 Transcript_120436/m.239695 type:complete len:232 (-) Transcript_120436:44-739(-)